MNKSIIYLLLHPLYAFAWVLLLFCGSALAQSERPQQSSPGSLANDGTAVMLRIANRDIVVLRATVENTLPEHRAKAAMARIDQLSNLELTKPSSIREFSLGKDNGYVFSVGSHPIFALLQSDIDPLSGVPLSIAAEATLKNLDAALRVLREHRRPQTLIYGAVRCLVGTIAFVIALLILKRQGNRTGIVLDRVMQFPLNWLNKHGIDITREAKQLSQYSLKVLIWLAFFSASYLWITYLLRQFPYTQPWGNTLAMNLAKLLKRVGLGFIHAAPNIATILIIFLVAHIVVKTLQTFFRSVEDEKISIPFIYPDTAGATRWLVTALVWIFAVAVAYPYIPGSHSPIFQGFSVIAGLMATFGSAGIINQGMSGLVLIYSRALTNGDYVQIGDTEGSVMQVGFLSTKLENLRHEEVTIPNSVIVGSQVKNYSRMEKSKGSTVSTHVSIGYDAPWRQVSALLQEAASQTNGIRNDMSSQVLINKLSDFYTEYELVAPIVRPEMREEILSKLHEKILDLFNEHGVQIMSPNFEAQPDEKVYVPKENWFLPPANQENKLKGKTVVRN